MTSRTHHACALEIDQIGILIIGKSGSGKTSLMMGLLERAKQENKEAYLVTDDRVHLKTSGEKLDAETPGTIAGLVEIRGYGVIAHPNKNTTAIKLVVELVKDESIERMPEQKYYEFEGMRLPLLEVPIRHENQAVRIVFAWLVQKAGLHVA